MDHSGRFYYPYLAMLGPAALVMAGYYLLVPDDPWEFPKESPLGLIAAIVLALLLGVVNWYATEHGLY